MPAHCVYQAQQSSPYTRPQIQQGDFFCVDCPADNVCRGSPGQPSAIKIVDAQGTEATVRAALTNPSCTDCPPGAHQGYRFAPEASGGGSFP
jgi:hypothetical protein